MNINYNRVKDLANDKYLQNKFTMSGRAFRLRSR